MSALFFCIIIAILQITFQQNCEIGMQNDQFTTGIYFDYLGSYMFILNTGLIRKHCYNLPSKDLVKPTSSLSYGIITIIYRYKQHKFLLQF